MNPEGTTSSANESLHEPLIDPESSRREDEVAELTHSSSHNAQKSHSPAPNTPEMEELVAPEELIEPPEERRPLPLAWASTTPCWVKILLPVLVILCHGLFLKGQIQPMWRLSEHLDIDVWVNATGYEAKAACAALKLDEHQHFYIPNKNHNVKEFTYGYAIQELWRAHHMPGKLLWLARLAAVLLLLFSGVWPHVKLILLMLTWCCSRRLQRRKRILNTLGVLGKWSLVDVLVVCVMVGVLNLQWTIQGDVVLDRLTNHLPMVVQLIKTFYNGADAPQLICSQALHYSCRNPSKPKHKLQCHGCLSTVETFLKHPEGSGKPILQGLQSNGGGVAELYVAGLPGIYYFCAAVVLSILLSLLVDWYDHVARLRALEEPEDVYEEEDYDDMEDSSMPLLQRERLNTEEVSTTPEVSGTLSEGHRGRSNIDPTMESLMIPSGVDYRSSADRAFDERLLEAQQAKGRGWRILAATVTALCIGVSVTGTSLQRNVHGALPNLVHEVIGIEWTKSYSFLELVWTTGKAGQWDDYMLMGTFCFFIVVGPVLRAFLCLAVSCRRTTRCGGSRKTITAVDFLGAFCAWEVFGAALVMVDLLMPSITSTIWIDPRCSTMSSGNSKDGNCLEVQFNMLHTFGWVLTGGILLLLISAHIKMRHALY